MKKPNFRRVLSLLMALCMVICLLPMSNASAVAADDNSFDIPLSELEAVSARGGFTKPVVAGTYRIDEDVVDEMQHKARKEHAANLGSLLAWELTKGTDTPAYFVDPVSVDELPDVARITGFAEMERVSFVHALNHRSMARKAAAQLGVDFHLVVNGQQVL